MKIFDWMQSKLTGKPRLEKPSLKVFDDEKVKQKPSKEEANEWPHGLLAIGTLGNGDLKQDQQTNPPPSPNDHLHDFTPEEATHILNELSSYWNQSNSAALLELEKAPNKFLSKQSSLKPERTSTDNVDCDELPKENMSRFQRSSSVVLSRGKDVCLDNINSTIGKKSLSFLLKKVFVCSSGFAPAAAASGLRDPVRESRMEKILRAILHKKIYPQSSSTSTMSMKKYLENSNPKSAKANEGSKWDKTDSESSNNTGFLSIAAKLIG
ncbi:protein DEEPER ROOTING 1 [Pyrus x bretschneideri]|uniref:protein DEEPER ROOTING 1 n=1 Tax=Pyrus x bretschneideri TaxID=225117 RepID=UPI00202E6AF6|nr:protein DEEPER ROOTING 1 [Pyrus x bretschneideri]